MKEPRPDVVPLPTSRLLTTEQAASYCGVSVNTFRAYVRIAPIRFGTTVRYDRADIDRWIDEKGSNGMRREAWLKRLDDPQ